MLERYIEYWKFEDSHGAVFPFYNVDENDYFYAQVSSKAKNVLKSPFYPIEHKKRSVFVVPLFSNFDLVCRGKK